MAVLSYLISPLWIVPLVQRDNAFALFHAKQALVFNLLMLILGAVISTISLITCGIGAVSVVVIFPFLYPHIMGIIHAAQGKYEPMPWIGHYADKYFGGIVADRRPGQAGQPPMQPPGQPMG